MEGLPPYRRISTPVFTALDLHHLGEYSGSPSTIVLPVPPLIRGIRGSLNLVGLELRQELRGEGLMPGVL
jgi:hypothetical protein